MRSASRGGSTITLGPSGAAAGAGTAVAVAGAAAAAGGAEGASLAVGWGVGLGAAAGFTLDEAGGDTAADGEDAGGATPAVAGGAGAGVIALTAVLHDPESLARLRLRHSSASLPPGVTPKQFAMKSERQEARIAAI